MALFESLFMRLPESTTQSSLSSFRLRSPFIEGYFYRQHKKTFQNNDGIIGPNLLNKYRATYRGNTVCEPSTYLFFLSENIESRISVSFCVTKKLPRQDLSGIKSRDIIGFECAERPSWTNIGTQQAIDRSQLFDGLVEHAKNRLQKIIAEKTFLIGQVGRTQATISRKGGKRGRG